MGVMASQITSLPIIVYSTVYSGADQRKRQSSASLAFVWGIHRWPVNSPPKGPVTRKMFPFDGVIMETQAHVSQDYLWVERNGPIDRVHSYLAGVRTAPLWEYVKYGWGSEYMNCVSKNCEN